MGNYTVNVFSNDWARANEIDIEFSVGTSGFCSDNQLSVTSIDWLDTKAKAFKLGQLTRSDGVDLIVLNLQEVCKLLHRDETTTVMKSRDVSNRYTKLAFEHKNKTVELVSGIVGVFVDGKRFRNVLTAFRGQ